MYRVTWVSTLYHLCGHTLCPLHGAQCYDSPRLSSHTFPTHSRHPSMATPHTERHTISSAGQTNIIINIRNEWMHCIYPYHNTRAVVVVSSQLGDSVLGDSGLCVSHSRSVKKGIFVFCLLDVRAVLKLCLMSSSNFIAFCLWIISSFFWLPVVL